MNRKISKIISLVLMMALMSVVAVSASAEATVTYDGRAQDFIFAPDKLFGGFTDVMPGDSVTERITIDNDISEKVKIKVYVRCSGEDESVQGFLSQLKMNVDQVDNSNLFSNQADKLVDLTEWKYLGTVYSGGDIKLDLTLEVPAEMGNDFMDAEARIKWEFRVDELAIEPDDPAPETSDNIIADLFPWIAVIVVAAVTTGYYMKKKTAKR